MRKEGLTMDGAYPPGVTGEMIDQIEGREEDKFFEPDPACEYCEHYNGQYCTIAWNNMDESYCIPDRDEKEPDDCCDDYSWNGEPLEEPRKPEKPERKNYQSEGSYARALRYYNNELRLYNRIKAERVRYERGE